MGFIGIWAYWDMGCIGIGDMGEFLLNRMSFDSEWDKVVNVEHESFLEGKLEAEGEVDEAIFQEGEAVGFARGYELGVEVAYMQHVLLSSSFSDKSANATKRKSMLLAKIGALPSHNDVNFDFNVALAEIRSLFKSCTPSKNHFTRTNTASAVDW